MHSKVFDITYFMKLLPVLLIIIISFAGCSSENKKDASREELTSAITYKIILPPSLESRRAEFETYVWAAQQRINQFATAHQWNNLVTESYFDSVMVFDIKEAFDKTLLTVTESDPTMELPATYSAALEKRILLTVSPELYSTNYPEGIEENAYEKLLTHEIAHRLHIRILNNNEDLMGPIWFFEGFAIYAADQFTHSTTQLSDDEMRAIIQDTERGSYEKYAYLFRYFVNLIPLQTLLDKAGDPDFNSWLQTETVSNKP